MFCGAKSHFQYTTRKTPEGWCDLQGSGFRVFFLFFCFFFVSIPISCKEVEITSAKEDNCSQESNDDAEKFRMVVKRVVYAFRVESISCVSRKSKLSRIMDPPESTRQMKRHVQCAV